MLNQFLFLCKSVGVINSEALVIFARLLFVFYLKWGWILIRSSSLLSLLMSEVLHLSFSSWVSMYLQFAIGYWLLIEWLYKKQYQHWCSLEHFYASYEYTIHLPRAFLVVLYNWISPFPFLNVAFERSWIHHHSKWNTIRKPCDSLFLLFTRSRSKEAWISDLIVYIIELKVKIMTLSFTFSWYSCPWMSYF